MRIIKLSSEDKDFPTRDGVIRFFEETLPGRKLAGSFYITKPKQNMPDIKKGALLLFSYKTECMYLARADSGVIKDKDPRDPKFPAHFILDIKSITQIQSTLHDYQSALREKRISDKEIVKVRNWPELSDDCVEFTLKYFDATKWNSAIDDM